MVDFNLAVNIGWVDVFLHLIIVVYSNSWAKEVSVRERWEQFTEHSFYKTNYYYNKQRTTDDVLPQPLPPLSMDSSLRFSVFLSTLEIW